MQHQLREGLRVFEPLIFLIVGRFFTLYILRPLYGALGVAFVGNVWVIWFSASYVLYVLYAYIVVHWLKKENHYLAARLKSKFFWIMFAITAIIVLVPFFIGRNPF